jgi:tetratricopeptide (TPR) repeat protein
MHRVDRIFGTSIFPSRLSCPSCISLFGLPTSRLRVFVFIRRYCHFVISLFHALAVLLLLAMPARAASTADSVVSVIGWNSLAMWSGSGFVVGDGRWVVTCFHVAARKLANDRPLVPPRLTVISPWTGEAVDAQVVRTNSDADLALLRLEGPPLPALTLAPENSLDTEVLQDHPPEKVRLSGFPHLEAASDPAVPLRVVSAETEVVAVVNREQFPSLVLAPTPGPQKGWSGGPATWADGGAVVGVFFALVSRSDDPNHWFPHATPIQPLTAFLRGAGLDPGSLAHPTAAPSSPPADADQRFQHRMHAIVAAMDDRWDRMESEARALLKLTPDSAHAHSLLAVALDERQQAAAALREWDEAVRREPERAAFHAGRGDSLLQLGRIEEAAAAFRRAKALGPDDADLSLRLAEALSRMKQPQEAHRELERAVSLSPNHPIARWELGSSWSGQGKHAEALREMAAAVELAADLPIGSDFRLGYAAELERAGHPEAAEHQLRELLRREPDSLPAIMALAHHLADQHHPDEARSLAEKALAQKPDAETQKAIQRLLDRLRDKKS